VGQLGDGELLLLVEDRTRQSARTCHVAVWSHYAGAGPVIAFVRVGTLDDPDVCPLDIHIFTASKQQWVMLPPGAPAVPEYYDRDQVWPAASLERRRAIESKIDAYRAAPAEVICPSTES
jgi:hypothetical protein